MGVPLRKLLGKATNLLMVIDADAATATADGYSGFVDVPLCG